VSYASIKSTLGPRGRGRPVSLGAVGGADEQVAQLQAQINRFIVPPGAPLPLTGVLDQPTALAAQSIMITRFSRAFVEDPSNKETARLFAEANKNLGNALPWVRANLASITDTLRDYGDFIGRPPARGQGASSTKTVALAIAGLAAVAYAFRRKRR
jgi:hypothetical protein